MIGLLRLWIPPQPPPDPPEPKEPPPRCWQLAREAEGKPWENCDLPRGHGGDHQKGDRFLEQAFRDLYPKKGAELPPPLPEQKGREPGEPEPETPRRTY